MTTKNKYIYWKSTLMFLILSIFVAGVLTYIFFYKLAPNEFLYIADQFFKFSYTETFADAFFKRRLDNLSQHNSYTMVLGTWDSLLMMFSYSQGLSLIQTEKLIFFLTLLLSQVLAFWGFRKINEELKTNTSLLGLGIITWWYCFNPYTLVLWHGGVYNLTSGLTYSLLPLGFIYTYLVLTQKYNLKNILIAAVVLHVMTYTFWLFAVVLLLLCIFFSYLLYVNRDSKEFKIRLFKHGILLITLYFVLSAFIYVNIFDEFFTTQGNNNAAFSRNFENLQGGLLYPILLIFSWGIYTKWIPRTIYSFGDYFFSGPYIAATVWMYVLIIMGLYYKLKNKNLDTKTKAFLYGSLIVFSSTIFLAKGAQKPLGFIFKTLYDYLPFFKIFKSPELRFGFAIVFCISVILLIVANQINKYLFAISLSLVMLVQSAYFFNGKVIRGEYIPQQYFDRIVHLTQDQKELLEYINNSEGNLGYVLPSPSVEYGFFEFEGDPYIGPDLVQKESKLPFIYVSGYGGISTDTYQKLAEDFEDQKLDGLYEYPIKYVLLRKDTSCNGCPQLDETKFESELKLAFSNKTFKLYEVHNPTPLVGASNATIDYKVINPVKLEIYVRDISEETVILEQLLSFNEGWKIFPAPRDSSKNSELKVLLGQPIAQATHTKSRGYANQWLIDMKEITTLGKDFYTMNEDGTLNTKFILYYQPQNLLYISAAVTIASLIFVGALLVGRKNE